MRWNFMINFVEISLHDYHHLQEHDQLDTMLAEGWTIIGHSVFTNLDNEPCERYTLHKVDVPLIQKLVDDEMDSIDSAVLQAKRLGMS